MRILSFDCANRSLAVCCATVNVNFFDNLVKIRDKKDLNLHTEQFYNPIKIHALKVFDLTKGEKVDTIKRASLLKKCLMDLDHTLSELDVEIQTVLVEYQMSVNDKSRCVSQQIIYHYSCIPGINVQLVGPTLKNKVCFSPDETLEHGTFMAKYSSKYTANKNHSKSNFLYWLELNKMSEMLKENNIAKKNVDDIADAFMQIWGWLEFGKR